MASGVIVPVHVAAVCMGTRTETDAAQLGMADFSRLAYFKDDNYDYPDPAGPYTSGECLQETTGYLSTGVHLHWKLPDAVTVGEQSTEDAPADFPRVPNRWLVTRMILNGKELKSSASWVVESDRLSQQNPLREIQIPPATTVPVYAEDAEDFGDEGIHVGGLQPFRYLGAREDAKNWQELVDARTGEPREYLAEPREYQRPVSRAAAVRGVKGTARTVTPYGLTAAGFGDATFASFYPNCATAFGFFDSAEALSAVGYQPGMKLSYHVVGWYARPGDDVATRSPFKFAPPPATLPTATYDAELSHFVDSGLELEENETACYQAGTKWFFRSTAAQGADFGLYSGLVAAFDFDPNKAYTLPSALQQNDQIVIGNTTSEAVAALFAARLSRAGEADLEQLLHALQLGALDALAEPGGLDKTRRVMHRATFGSSPGGRQWAIVPKQDNPDARRPVPSSLVAKLARLNAEQLKCDELVEEGNSVRGQLMADWQKYLYLKRKPSSLMPISSIPQQWQAANGASQTQELLEKQLETLEKIDAAARQSRTEVSRLLAEVESGLAQLRNSHELTSGTSPEYWSPNEPAILLSGPALQLGDHGREDGRLRADNYVEVRAKVGSLVEAAGRPLTCPLTAAALRRTHAADIIAGINDLLNEAFQVATGHLAPERIPSHEIAVNRAANEWQPLLMLWEITYRPQALTKSAYPSNLLTDPTKFQLNPATGELEALGDPVTEEFRYEGKVPLAAGAPVSLESQIEACLDYVDDPSEKEKLAELLADLGEMSLLSQSLAGLNAAMLMRVQKYQLPVCDTLYGFPEDLEFSNQMRAAIGRQGDLGENSAAPYSPLRAGLMHLSGLTVVDCFGRRLPLDLRKQLVARTLRAPTQVLQTYNWFRVPPRIVAPSRLLFRWGVAAPATSRSPVCGWVMFNRFDNALLVYAPAGDLLGTVQLADREGRLAAYWHGAPGTATWMQNADNALAQQSSYLQSFVRDLLANAGYARAFMQTVDRALALSPNQLGPDVSSAPLLSKPLGLVRASLKWDLEGVPPVDQSWESLRTAAQSSGGARYTAGVEKLGIPVKLGIFSDPGDGLIGFFLDGNRTFYSSASQSPEVPRPTDNTVTLTCSPDDEKHLTLLINPYGRVNVTTGLLPVTQLSLAPEEYETPLQSLKSTFLIAPVISREVFMADPAEPTQTIIQALPMPVPDETLEHGEWSWLEQTGQWGGELFRRIGVANPEGQNMKNYFPQMVREGWLTLEHIRPGERNAKKEGR